jgi:cobalt-zinc-cadmium efflux system protein
MDTHHHDHDHANRNTLLWALVITFGFAFVEAFSGWIANSLALMGDAGHMFTDSSALGLAALAAWLAKRPPSHRHSYGLVRAEIVAALINSLFMIVVVIGITLAAIDRLQQPRDVSGGTVMAVAFIGLLVNLAVAWVLHHGEQTLNTRAAMLHVMGDLLGSVAALVAGIVIYYTGWTAIDPLLSLLICALILISSLRLLREALHVIMEGVPFDLDLPDVGKSMAAIEGVVSVHDLHIWSIASGVIALSAHVTMRDASQWQAVLAQLQTMLHDRFDIHHTTLQPEFSDHLLQRDLPRTQIEH